MSLEDGTELAIKALYSAIRRDSASGGEMEVVVITKDKYETLSEERIKEIRNSLN
jgi:proteasome beta subunit